MDKKFDPLIQGLTATAGAVLAISPAETRALNVVHNTWNIPGISLPELAELAKSLSEDIKAYGLDVISESQSASVAELTQRVEFMRTQTVPHIWGGNGAAAIPAFIVAIEQIRKTLTPMIPRVETVDPKAMPSQTARRIRRLNDEVDQIVFDRAALMERMKAINDAYEAAQTLPEDLDSLREAREEIARISKEATNNAHEVGVSKKGSADGLAVIEGLRSAAAKLVDQCEEAYRVTTSKGLAGAFELRAQGLTRTP